MSWAIQSIANYADRKRLFLSSQPNIWWGSVAFGVWKELYKIEDEEGRLCD